MHEYGDLLLRTACLLLRDRQAAEEAVQDTFVQAYAKIGQLHDPNRLKPWLIRILVNRCRMRQRSWNWRNIFPGGAAEELPESQDRATDGADESFFRDWQKGRLASTIHRLDYRYRESIVLHYYHELTIREIAEQLDANENTIKSRLMRGRSLLRSMLQEEERT